MDERWHLFVADVQITDKVACYDLLSLRRAGRIEIVVCSKISTATQRTHNASRLYPHPEVHALRAQCSDEIVETYPSASSVFVEESELLLQEHGSVVCQPSASVWDLVAGRRECRGRHVSYARTARWVGER